MIASKDDDLKEAAQTIFRMSADEEIRKRCRDREEYYQDLRSYERVIAEKEEKIERDRKEHEEDLRNYEKTIAEKEENLRNYERSLCDYEKRISAYERERKERADEIAQLRVEIERLKGN